MDNEPAKLPETDGCGRALAFCGVALMAVGIGMAGVPVRGPGRLPVALAPSLCCSPAAQMIAGLPPAIAVPTLHAPSTILNGLRGATDWRAAR